MRSCLLTYNGVDIAYFTLVIQHKIVHYEL